MSKAQLNEIISALKVMAQQSKDAARQLLLARPQLSKALFQTQIMLGLVNPKVLQMANIRQLSGQSVVSLPQDACQGLRTVVPNLPILTPLARQSQVPVLTQNSLSQNQLPVASLPPSQAQTLVSRYTGDAPPQHVAFPVQSGAPAHPSIRPQIQKAPPISSSMPDAVSKVADRSAHRNNAYLNIHRSSTDDAREQNNRPSKLLKLDDGRSTFLPGSSSASNTLGSGPSKTFAAHSMTTYPLPKPEVSPYVDKQSSQLPSDVESALLQQVLSLTPEQVSSLPPDQQRQVIWLQQALRQDQLQAS